MNICVVFRFGAIANSTATSFGGQKHSLLLDMYPGVPPPLLKIKSFSFEITVDSHAVIRQIIQRDLMYTLFTFHQW